ncbi:MAG: bifunctional riboflavin kinase/FAD synthetase [Verrucomicrobia bacterium]|nr:bifunctional riboflavin kinase/FAD synthetase [Verrucomicrobiota bacterium]
MKVLHSLAELASLNRPLNVAIGVFDGVHLGHQRVIAHASVVLTFDPHPMRVLHPDKAPPLLTSTPHKLALIQKLGVDVALVLPFTREFADIPAETFLEQLATHRVRQICVGARFHFGHNRAGNATLMERHAARLGYTVNEIPAVHTADGEMISSSAVRAHVLHGRLDRAAAMLGRPFRLLGTVEPGDQRGRSLGFPTANLNLHNEVLPPDGVYAARVGQRIAVVNVGLRPTFQHATPGRLIEVHLLDFTGDLYGQDIEVALIQKLRGEQKFPNIEALQAQIRADIAQARRLLT